MAGTAALPVFAQATIDSGVTETVDGTAPFTGTQGSLWAVGGVLNVGHTGVGNLEVIEAGVVSNTNGYIGRHSGSTGIATITGAGSKWINTANFYVGRYGEAVLSIEDGGDVSSTRGYIGGYTDAVSTATITGTGSNWTITGTLEVGFLGEGTLNIEDGGTVNNATSFIANGIGYVGTVMVTGDGSKWANSGSLVVGTGGNGTLTIADSGLVQVGATGDGVLRVACGGDSTGTLNIGAASGDAAVAAGQQDALAIVFGLGSGTVVFNHTDTAYDFDMGITGAGSVDVMSGTAILSVGSDYTGDTTITGGTLRVNWAITSGTYVSGAGVLGGTGYVGDVFVQSGGTLAPGNSIGTLSAGGDVDFASGSNFDVEIDAAGNSDVLLASGDVTIQSGATLNIGPEALSEDGSTYDLVTNYMLIAANSVTGVFDTVTGSFAFLDALVTYEAANVYLTMYRNDVDLTTVATTANQIATAGAISDLSSGSTVYQAIIVLDISTAPMAFDLLSGEIHPTTRSLLPQNSQFALSAARNHDGGAGINVWGDVMGGWAQIDSEGNAATATQSIYGTFSGPT